MIHQEGSEAVITGDFIDALTDMSVVAGVIQKKFGDDIPDSAFIAAMIKSIMVGVLDTKYRGIVTKGNNIKTIAELSNWFASGMVREVIEGGKNE